MSSFGVFFFACACAAVIAISGVQGSSLECPQICPLLYRPICAKTEQSQYLQYSNDCVLKAFNCRRQKSDLPTHDQVDLDFCKTTELTEGLGSFAKDLQEAHPSCFKACTDIFRPVCGSNGSFRATFSNDCEMEMFDCVHRHQNKNGWRLIGSSQCSDN